MWTYQNPDELFHYGVLGMKWGVRRYQNKDGSLTPAGKKRQAKLMGEYQQLTGKNLKYASMAKAKKAKAAANQKPRAKSVSELSDAELQQKVNRARLEKDYFDLNQQIARLNPPHVSAGQKFWNAAKDVAGTALKEAAKDATTKYAKKMLSKALGVDDKVVEDASKSLAKEATDLGNRVKIESSKAALAKMKAEKEDKNKK